MTTQKMTKKAEKRPSSASKVVKKGEATKIERKSFYFRSRRTQEQQQAVENVERVWFTFFFSKWQGVGVAARNIASDKVRLKFSSSPNQPGPLGLLGEANSERRDLRQPNQRVIAVGVACHTIQ